MTGVQTCALPILQAVKGDMGLEIPIIVLSSRGQPEEVEKAMDLGADGYLIKTTAKPKEVVEKIKQVLGEERGEIGRASCRERV